MEKYRIGFYISSGRKPVDDFAQKKSALAQAKIDYFYRLLMEQGPLLHGPYAKKLTSKIYELRPGVNTEEFRIVYFWHGSIAIMLHAVDRKDMKQRDIKLAEKRRFLLLQSWGVKSK